MTELYQVKTGAVEAESRAVLFAGDDVVFDHPLPVTGWFTARPSMEPLFLPSYSPEELSSSWRWTVSFRHPSGTQ